MIIEPGLRIPGMKRKAQHFVLLKLYHRLSQYKTNYVSDLHYNLSIFGRHICTLLYCFLSEHLTLVLKEQLSIFPANLIQLDFDEYLSGKDNLGQHSYLTNLVINCLEVARLKVHYSFRKMTPVLFH